MRRKTLKFTPQTIWCVLGRRTRTTAVWRSMVRHHSTGTAPVGGVILPHLAPPPPSVYSEKEDHSYCHHEVLLSAFPLTLEWMDFDPDEPKQRGGH